MAERKEIIDKVCAEALAIAHDESHGYSQAENRRWGNPDFDCSSLVITCWDRAGIPVKQAGATFTGNMAQAFEKCGFVKMEWKESLKLEKGDVLLKPNRHTALYIGNMRIVHARGSENGTKYGNPGDQTGREILETNYYIPTYKWRYVLRYAPEGMEMVEVKVQKIKKGDKNDFVTLMQMSLNNLGFRDADGKALVIDGSFGGRSDFALKKYQAARGLTVDGICGENTWQRLLSERFR